MTATASAWSSSTPGSASSRSALTRVFDAFAQGSDRITREFGGLGLGLAISKATVDAHDGTMTAESAGTNRGTTITITLPLI